MEFVRHLVVFPQTFVHQNCITLLCGVLCNGDERRNNVPNEVQIIISFNASDENPRNTNCQPFLSVAKKKKTIHKEAYGSLSCRGELSEDWVDGLVIRGGAFGTGQ
jgi:hypothetical protein